MPRLPQVEQARAVMTEAQEWSVVKWLREKRRVRKMADQANAALDELNRQTKALWPAEMQRAYAAARDGERAENNGELSALIQRVLQADEHAKRARADAEATFDEAESQLSARLAREGCGKAIRSWELHEKAIRQCEAGVAKIH